MGNDCCKSKKGAEIEKFKAERTAAGMDDSSTPTPTKSNKVGSVNGDDERLAELYKGLDE